jgi:hypothetical protein
MLRVLVEEITARGISQKKITIAGFSRGTDWTAWSGVPIPKLATAGQVSGNLGSTQTLGYYRNHAVPGNIARLHVFAQRLRRLLGRRSQRGRATWDRLTPIFERWIPEPRILHPYPLERFVATHPRWEPYA